MPNKDYFEFSDPKWTKMFDDFDNFSDHLIVCWNDINFWRKNAG
jgi:hypothetical protein